MLISLLLHVALAVAPTPDVPPAIIRAALVEAGDIWAPYGVAIDAARSECAADERIVLTIDPLGVPSGARGAAVTPSWRGPLGAIAFAPDGVPESAIAVFLTDIERLIASAHLMGLSQWQWPTSLREHLIGRVVGRVLAHEIGHYLLRSRQHSAGGLMRPLQLVDDLISPSRHNFRFTPADLARLGDLR